jgi:hypothetical protein
VLLSPEGASRPRKALEALFSFPLLLVVCVTPEGSQKTQPEDDSLPKYDFQTARKPLG